MKTFLRLTSQFNTDTLAGMIRCIPALLLMLSAAAHAAPAQETYSDMDALLADKGLMTRLGDQLQQARISVSDQASGLVINAMAFLGVPYKWGGNSYDTGFDCSGFVRAVYEQSAGKLLPRQSHEQAAATQEIDRNDLKPGDLVFFNTMRRAFSHVGIYVGEGRFIHSPRAGAHVRMEDMSLSYWNKRFNGARRVLLDAHTLEPGASTMR
ncbi:cell wall-associated NlpC family hydrolase [Hydrogenophaga palleronii]|uniref:Cell wall-associated NlpC family hydrolase n=2 Tax=Hydrogenophaga palleronii TaxID=65655 RepID=A0ABU1WHV7_9BURK|nr:cell wall-associated NlpC family hydrolase [Hydrogenophaga palleronii]